MLNITRSLFALLLALGLTACAHTDMETKVSSDDWTEKVFDTSRGP
jgi:hypothetical protein